MFPPTYVGATYATEQRRLPGREEPVACVLLDSVQSQANRMEEALQEAVDAGRIQIPLIEVDFGQANLELLKPIDERITSLTVPHRLADAILRDSELDDGTAFSKSDHAEYWRQAGVANATPVYELCPTALVFGIWGAPEKPGGLGAKFERLMSSEIVGVDVTEPPERRGLRMGPLGIVRGAAVHVGEEGEWQVAEGSDRNAKRPSEINHGPIPFDTPNGGVSISSAQQTMLVSLAGLRRLKFPPKGEKWEPSDEQRRRDLAARTVLASLAL